MYRILQLIVNIQYVAMRKMDFLKILMLKLNLMVVKIVIVLLYFLTLFYNLLRMKEKSMLYWLLGISQLIINGKKQTNQ
jgi:hypothetical protein